MTRRDDEQWDAEDLHWDSKVADSRSNHMVKVSECCAKITASVSISGGKECCGSLTVFLESY
jgi:hypothetical protein